MCRPGRGYCARILTLRPSKASEHALSREALQFQLQTRGAKRCYLFSDHTSPVDRFDACEGLCVKIRTFLKIGGIISPDWVARFGKCGFASVGAIFLRQGSDTIISSFLIGVVHFGAGGVFLFEIVK